MSRAADARRRWLGLFFLAGAAALLVAGQTLLRPHLQGLGFAFYWLACFGFTSAALLIALVDLRAVRRRLLEEHRAQQAELLRRTFADLPPTPPSPPPDPPPGHRNPSDSARQSP
ncbi:MAG: hypothetical protein RJA22_1588 [Verrucomicrobiota bacterium]|jgi:heme exporter protein D